jgi:hypothetical protein
MKLFKGEKTKNDKINWTNPMDLPEKPSIKSFSARKAIIHKQCASCHALGKVITGLIWHIW